MVHVLRMRISHWNMRNQVSWAWPMLAKTPMARNSLSQPCWHHGWMDATLYSVKCLKTWSWFIKLKIRQPIAVTGQRRMSPSAIAAFWATVIYNQPRFDLWCKAVRRGAIDQLLLFYIIFCCILSLSKLLVYFHVKNESSKNKNTNTLNRVASKILVWTEFRMWFYLSKKINIHTHSDF